MTQVEKGKHRSSIYDSGCVEPPADNAEADPLLEAACKRLAEWEVLMAEVASRKAAFDQARFACWTAKSPEEYSVAVDGLMKLLRQRSAEGELESL